ncbi:MAG: patatin-like phospholipase family protein [Bacteroidota bacterium]|nr:patatin-like phospholipase family protein [Bacteroidota bacterium]
MNKEIGLALSGGAARCIAHLGVIQALEEIGIKPAAISGVSGGAIVGAFYANGYSPLQILEIIKKTSILKALSPAFDTGILKMDKAEKVYAEYFKTKEIENLKIPLTVSACDLNKGIIVSISSGDLIKAVIASSSVPMIFKPVEFEGMKLIDGGIINNMPVDPLKNYSIIIGVNVNVINPELKIDSFYSNMQRNIDIIVTTNIKESITMCNLFIEPPEMKNIRLTDINKADEIYTIGYKYTKKNYTKIQEILEAISLKTKKI